MKEDPRRKRRALRRRRRWIGFAVLLAPTLWSLGSDWLRRASHLVTLDWLHGWGYVGSFFATAVFWGVILYVAARRHGILRQVAAGLFVVLYGFSLAVQSAFHSFYNVYLSHDGLVYSRDLPEALLGQLPLQNLGVALRVLFAFVLTFVFLILARHWVRPRPLPRRFAPLLVPLVLVGMGKMPASYRSWQSSSPESIYFQGLLDLFDERLRKSEHAPELRVQRRRPEPVPVMVATPARPRNVLLILQESLRYDITCNAYDPDAIPARAVQRGESTPSCATPFSNQAAPQRMPLDQMRAGSATTAISISNLWSGISPLSSFEQLLSAPLLWDFADAAGYNGAYWTSQNVMFGSMRLYVQDIPTSHRAVATELDPTADFDAGANDALLSDRVIEDWASVDEPFFAVVHYSNVHFPYVYDKTHAPFQPAEFTKDRDKNEQFFNYYRNVAYLSDMAVGRLLDHVRASDKGKRTVILYTSDHGESFREHWQLGHTSSIYDEEVKVPAWIDAPINTLSDDEEASVRGAQNEFTWHYDLHATMLDLLGLWDAPEMKPFRQHMLGLPLTRPQRTTRPVPITNCAWIWECGFRNWGLMQGPMKLEAREWDNEFHCFDLANDPLERTNLGEQGCAPLAARAREMFGPMPVQPWPGGKNLLWGPPAPSASAAPEG